MCNCAWTSFDLLAAVNEKRGKAGLTAVSYDWVMAKWRTKSVFFKPAQQIGGAYVWEAKTARRIIRAIWRLRYTPCKSWQHHAAAA